MDKKKALAVTLILLAFALIVYQAVSGSSKGASLPTEALPPGSSASTDDPGGESLVPPPVVR